MTSISKADAHLLELIQRGDGAGWRQFVTRYQGRLLAFARSKLGQTADAEDIVQDTFLSFLRTQGSFRGQSSLETYLFTILRHKIIDTYRHRAAAKVCLLQDLRSGTDDSAPTDPLARLDAHVPTASWYARRDEQHTVLREQLGGVLAEWVESYKQILDFANLKLLELLFYCQAPNKTIAATLDLTPNQVAVTKHRYISRLRDRLAASADDLDDIGFESLLTGVWENLRISCLKRSTVGAYLLGTLDTPWTNYAEFHLNVLGCAFCRANLDDVTEQNQRAESAAALHKRIMESTVGFLKPQR